MSLNRNNLGEKDDFEFSDLSQGLVNIRKRLIRALLDFSLIDSRCRPSIIDTLKGNVDFRLDK